MDAYKKRHRIPASCSVCRKRKSKCDRVKPICGSCKKKLIAHLCFYETEYEPEPKRPQNIMLSPPLHHLPPPSLAPHMGHQAPPNQLLGSLPGHISAPPPPSHLHQPPSGLPHSHQPPPGPSPHETHFYGHISHHSRSEDFRSPSSYNLLSNTTPPLYQLQHTPSSLPFALGSRPSHENILLPLPQTVLPPLLTASSDSHSTDRHRLSVLLPPVGLSSSEKQDLVSVSIGPSSLLKVNSFDTLELPNASVALIAEGWYWHEGGFLLHFGLTKSDPFLSILRNFSIAMLRSGEISQYVQLRKYKPKPSKTTPHDVLPPKNDEEKGLTKTDNALQPSPSEKSIHSFKPQKSDAELEEDNFLGEDGLLLTKIEQKKTTISSRSSSDNLFPGILQLATRPLRREEFYRVVESVVLKVLPRKRNIFTLFCRFFKHVFPFVPVLDEVMTMQDIKPLFDDQFPEFAGDFYTAMTITSDEDLLSVAILLLTTRLGYMLMIHNDPAANKYSEEEQGMEDDMVRFSNEKWADVVTLCLPDERMCLKSTFKTVQCLTLLHFYRLVVPSDCHGLTGQDLQILFGAIIKHAFSIGLNRDPSKYVAHEVIYKKEPLVKVWRRLWYYLVTVDAVNAMHSGSVLNIRDLDISDVEEPLWDTKTRTMNEVTDKLAEVCSHYRALCIMLSSVRKQPRVVDMLAETNRLETIFFDYFGKDFFKEYICKPVPSDPAAGTDEHEESFVKVLKFRLFIHLRTNLSCMYYVIAKQYEADLNNGGTPSMAAGIELFKIYIRSVVQLVYIMLYVLEYLVDLFGRNYDYILTAHNEREMIKIHVFVTSFFTRLLHHKKLLTIQQRQNPDSSLDLRLGAVDTLFAMILIEAELFVGNFKTLSKKYRNSYKLYVMTYFVLKQCMENPERFFQITIEDKRFFHDGANMLSFFTLSELQHLCTICEEFRIAKLELNQRRQRARQNDKKLDVNTSNPAFHRSSAQHTDTESAKMPLSVENLKGLKERTSSSTPGQFFNNSLSDVASDIPLYPLDMAENPLMTNEDLMKLFYGDVDPTLWK